MLNFIFILQKVRVGLGDLMDSWTPCMNLITGQESELLLYNIDGTDKKYRLEAKTRKYQRSNRPQELFCVVRVSCMVSLTLFTLHLCQVLQQTVEQEIGFRISRVLTKIRDRDRRQQPLCTYIF